MNNLSFVRVLKSSYSKLMAYFWLNSVQEAGRDAGSLNVKYTVSDMFRDKRLLTKQRFIDTALQYDMET